MSRILRASLLAALSLLACSISRNAVSTTSATALPNRASPTTESVTAAAPESSFDIPDDAALPTSGKLAIVGLDGNIYQADSSNGLVSVTSDAILVRQSPAGITYGHPTWSTDGWLSYVKVDTVSPVPSVSLLAAHPSLDQPQQLFRTSDSNYIYGYWAPATICDQGVQCGRIAYLMSGGTTIELHLAEASTDPDFRSSDIILDRASPFYYSWSADGDQMLWHQNSNMLSIFDTATGTIDELPDIPGAFQAPSWSPVDDRLLFSVEDGANSSVNIASADERKTVDTSIAEAAYFLWSPDGRFIAHASGEYPVSDLTITNSESLQGVELSVFEEVISFFWSPDSTRLAVVTVEPYVAPLPEAILGSRRVKPSTQDDSPSIVLAWWLVDAESGESRRLTQFLATPEQFYIFQYFDQYAQSHRIWSPDSHYITYAHAPLNGGDPEVVLLNTTSSDPSPEVVLNGLQAIFSFTE